MYKQHGQFHFSLSDLTRYMESPFASWMDRFSIEHLDQAPEKDSADALMSSLAQKGYEHEDALEAAFVGQCLNVVKIEGESSDDKHINTLTAMHQSVDVIVQARLELPPFGGYADFLVKVTHEAESSSPSKNKSSLGDWHYEVWDTKLANKLKPTSVIQLCCYAQMLEAIQGCLPVLKHKKLMSLLECWPLGLAATSAWMKTFGVTTQLTQRYLQSGWVAPLGHDVYKKAKDAVKWYGALASIQQQLASSVHLGGPTAHGSAHYIRIVKERVFLFSLLQKKLPQWF